jgi:hypothetical protein
MESYDGGPTTGLLNAVRYLKDNRVLPKGFDKHTADAFVAVVGSARTDDDFTGGSDRVEYAIDVGDHAGPLTIEAELLYQPIAYRWARNLSGYDAVEPQRFVRYYEAMAMSATELLARTTVRTGE